MKASSFAVVVLICSCFVLIACQPKPGKEKDSSNSFNAAEVTVPRTLTGQVTGPAQAVYTLSEGQVTCTDEAAEYQLTLSKDNKIPDGSGLTDKLPDNSYYFSLDINAVMRILEDGKCLVRDPSDDRVHMKIEGYFYMSSHEFTPLTCSRASSFSDSEIYASSEYVVKGEVECTYSDQMKYAFKFADLKLR